MWGPARVGVFLLLLFTLVTSESADKIQATNQENGNLGLNFNRSNFDAGCSRIFINEQVLLESPGYPSGYPSNSDCSYVFKGSACPTYFNLQFLDFNLMSSIGCVDDRLEIDNKDALCGSNSGIKSYFSESGTLQARFISDGKASGRGFKILVTRQPCGYKPETTTADPNIAWEITQATVTAPRVDVLPPVTPLTPQGSNLHFCCASAYNSKRFFLSSPGFPYSNNNGGECVYHIYRANSNVCRLRIHFLFFWSGEQDPNYGCNKGFLQVDGKFICGCRIGLKLISAFDSRWGNTPKVLKFKNSGFPRSLFNGFALEVFQDECPKRIAPTDKPAVKAQDVPFYFYNDQINKVAWPTNDNNKNSVQRALLVSENTEILEDENNPDSNTDVVKHVYYFEAPDDHDYGYDVRSGVKRPREIEETTYVDTSAISMFLPDGYDNNKCRAWGTVQWMMLAKEILWQQMPQCNYHNQPTGRQCEQFDYVRGYVQSPGYPNYYPENLRVCYRLNRQRGYCGIRMNFVDFNLEDSFECRKDFLLLGGEYRYCGQNLHKAVLTFDLRNKPYEEIILITDGYSCGRGFKATYEQIPCDNVGVPVNPPNPVYPTKPTTPFPPLQPPPPQPQPPKPQMPCGRDIQDDFFVVEVYGNNQARCIFNIRKRNPSVCRLSLMFLNFDLPCGSEHLLINNRRYCGQISGQTLNVNFNNYQLPIIYERSTGNPVTTGLRLRISGSQMSDGCDPYQYPSVPAERLFFTSNTTNSQLLTNSKTPADNRRIYSERKYDNDACGIILNASEDTIASSICNFIAQRDNSTKCVPITAKEIYVPYNIERSQLQKIVLNEIDTMKSFYNVEEVGVNEISCDDINKISL